MRMNWAAMRDPVIECFPTPPNTSVNTLAYLKQVDDIYMTDADADAYHSLSIEGYKVSFELIERVRRGEWDPDLDKTSVTIEMH